MFLIPALSKIISWFVSHFFLYLWWLLSRDGKLFLSVGHILNLFEYWVLGLFTGFFLVKKAFKANDRPKRFFLRKHFYPLSPAQFLWCISKSTELTQIDLGLHFKGKMLNRPQITYNMSINQNLIYNFWISICWKNAFGEPHAGLGFETLYRRV